MGKPRYKTHHAQESPTTAHGSLLSTFGSPRPDVSYQAGVTVPRAAYQGHRVTQRADPHTERETVVYPFPAVKLKGVVDRHPNPGQLSPAPHITPESGWIAFISLTVKTTKGEPMCFYKVLKSRETFSLKLQKVLFF